MKTINFLLQGFGFADLTDARVSTFGFMMSKGVLSAGAILGFIKTLFGVDAVFLGAFALLLICEWWSGVQTAKKKGEKHESKKFGRMLFKIFVYCSILIILNTFSERSNMPVIGGFELDPFNWLYWFAVIVIIWQLFVSYLENLEILGFAWAGKLSKLINKKFYQKLNLKDTDADDQSYE